MIDINADVGESYGRFKVGNDKSIIPLLTSCNIACGMHGGDPLTIQSTVELALQHDLKIGAHPSYPDLEGFGRRSLSMTSKELEACLLYQISALKGIVETLGGKLHHVKPHGALNNDMMKDKSLLTIIEDVVERVDPSLKLYVPFDKQIEKKPQYLWEVFADRTYEDDLSLSPRTKPNSLISEPDEARKHLSNILNRGKVKTETQEHTIEADTLCVHGDNPGAVEILRTIHEILGN